VLGVDQRENDVPVHGDFAPWNSSVEASGRVTLWDWEETRMGMPLEDYFHWEFQRLLRFGSGDARSLVMEALSGTGRVRYACRRLGVDPALAPVCFRAYLESSLEDATLVGPDVHLRREALGLLASLPADFASVVE
jgi:hypothetical protein